MDGPPAREIRLSTRLVLQTKRPSSRVEPAFFLVFDLCRRPRPLSAGRMTHLFWYLPAVGKGTALRQRDLTVIAHPLLCRRITFGDCQLAPGAVQTFVFCLIQPWSSVKMFWWVLLCHVRLKKWNIRAVMRICNYGGSARLRDVKVPQEGSNAEKSRFYPH